MGYDRDKLLGEMLLIMCEQIGQHDTEHPVFHGCIDWHSAAHGHWGIFRVANVTKKHGDAAAIADRSLDAGRLKAEAKYLREHPGFEMPYGRAWFLRLAMEFETWSREAGGKDPERLRPMAEAVALSLAEHYAKSPPSPDTHEYENASWAFAQMYDWALYTKSGESAASIAEIVKKRFERKPPPSTFAGDLSREEFFSPTGNWLYLMSKTQDETGFEASLTSLKLDEEALRPILVKPESAHGLGLNWSRAWALAAMAQKGPEKDRERYRKAFDAHVVAAMKHHHEMEEDVMAYRHWVPQFAVYALTEGR